MIEFICKHGAPQIVILLKRDQHKISSLSNFVYNKNGIDRGSAIRDKVDIICDLLCQEARLTQVRAAAFEYRNKYYPTAGPN